MSFLLAAPQELADAASDLAGVGSTLSTANAAASAPTTGLLPAAADEVSTQIAKLFSAHAKGFQQLSAQAAAFHEQFVQALTASANTYVDSRSQRRTDTAECGECARAGGARAPADRQQRRLRTARRWRRAHWSSRPQRAAAGAHRWGQWRPQRRPAAQVVVEHDQRRGSTCGRQLDWNRDRERLPRDRALRAVRLRAGHVRGGVCALGRLLGTPDPVLVRPLRAHGAERPVQYRRLVKQNDHLQPRAEQLLCGHHGVDQPIHSAPRSTGRSASSRRCRRSRRSRGARNQPVSCPGCAAKAPTPAAQTRTGTATELCIRSASGPPT